MPKKTDEMNKILTLLLFFTLLSFSCKKEHIEPQPEPELEVPQVPYEQRFELNIDLTKQYENQFIIVSNTEGEVVFDTMLTVFSGTKRINAFDDEELHLTHGRGNGSGSSFFDINTYANIRSGFTYRDYETACENNPFSRVISLHKLNLVIRNVSSVDSVFVSFSTRLDTPPVFDFDNNEILIEGSIASDQNYLVTLKTNSPTPIYKSYLLRITDMGINNQEGPQEVDIELDFSEFEEALVHEIDLGGTYEDWIIDISGIQDDGSQVQIFRTYNFLEFQEGNTLKIFRLPDLSFDHYEIIISSSNVYNKFKYKKIEDDIPSEILFHDAEVVFNEKSKRSFNVSLSDEFNLTCLRYDYRVNGFTNYWSTYTHNEREIDIILPQIPSEILNRNLSILTSLSNPKRLTVQMIRIDDFSNDNFIDLKYDDKLDCSNYTFRSKSEEF